MRIALDGIPLLSHKTGIGRYTSELAAALKRLPGVSRVVVFYGIHWSKRIRGISVACKDQTANDLYGGRIAKTVPEALKGWLRRQAAKLEFSLRRPDIFHATNYVADTYDVPMVVTVHDLSFLRYPETHPAERLRWLEEGLSSTLDRAGLIITDSQFTKEELISLLGIRENKVHVVYLGVTPGYRPREKTLLTEKLKAIDLSPDSYILSVGTLEPRKNIPALLEAYEALPNSLKKRWPLVAVGLHGWKNHALADRLRKLSRNGHIRHLGYVPDDTLPFLYAGATLFVYPSLYEGFGLPVLEAMASGVPVIASNRASLPEVAGRAGALVDPENVDLMAEIMKSILEDPEKRRGMARMGLAQAGHFTWTNCAEKTFQVYREVLLGQKKG